MSTRFPRRGVSCVVGHAVGWPRRGLDLVEVETRTPLSHSILGRWSAIARSWLEAAPRAWCAALPRFLRRG